MKLYKTAQKYGRKLKSFGTDVVTFGAPVALVGLGVSSGANAAIDLSGLDAIETTADTLVGSLIAIGLVFAAGFIVYRKINKA